jgi:hypothetical protein
MISHLPCAAMCHIVLFSMTRWMTTTFDLSVWTNFDRNFTALLQLILLPISYEIITPIFGIEHIIKLRGVCVWFWFSKIYFNFFTICCWKTDNIMSNNHKTNKIEQIIFSPSFKNSAKTQECRMSTIFFDSLLLKNNYSRQRDDSVEGFT